MTTSSSAPPAAGASASASSPPTPLLPDPIRSLSTRPRIVWASRRRTWGVCASGLGEGEDGLDEGAVVVGLEPPDRSFATRPLAGVDVDATPVHAVEHGTEH